MTEKNQVNKYINMKMNKYNNNKKINIQIILKSVNN